MKKAREAQLMNAMVIHKNFAKSIMALIRQTHKSPPSVYTHAIMFAANRIVMSLNSIISVKKSSTPSFPRKDSLRLSITSQRMTK